MQSIETDDIICSILNASEELTNAISGGIYVMGERPDDSEAEDIVINNLFLSHDMPQTGTSNINIHVTDLKVNISGKEQRKGHRERIREITSLVMKVIKAANIPGLTIRIANETIIKEPNISQHYNNIRIEWNIQRTN